MDDDEREGVTANKKNGNDNDKDTNAATSKTSTSTTVTLKTASLKTGTPPVSCFSEEDELQLSNIGQALEMSNLSSFWNSRCIQCFDLRKDNPSEYYTAIYSLEEEFNLIVYDCSHKLCATHGNNSIKYHKHMKRTVKVN